MARWPGKGLTSVGPKSLERIFLLWVSSASALRDDSRLFSLSAFPFCRYETQASLSGPYLTSVMGKAAGEREFWQLLRDPDTPLLQGIADYRPKDGETIELRLVSW